MVRGIDTKGEVNKDSRVLEQAARFGSELAARLSDEHGRGKTNYSQEV